MPVHLDLGVLPDDYRNRNMLDSAAVMNSRFAFLAHPQWRTLRKPNTRLITPIELLHARAEARLGAGLSLDRLVDEVLPLAPPVTAAGPGDRRSPVPRPQAWRYSGSHKRDGEIIKLRRARARN